MSEAKTYVISLGGSIIVPPEGIDWKFLKKFRKLIISRIKLGERFVIVTGGGATCRAYQQAAVKVTKLTKEDRDWLGIHTTRLNAHLIKTIFREFCHPRINKNPNTKEDLKRHFSKGEGMMVAAGWRPGFSTDHDAVILASRIGAKTIINLSNISYVYDKDPKKYPRAKRIEKISWTNFRKIVGDKWDPGLNAPFDPIASREAQRLKLEAVIMNGKNLTNLVNYFEGREFKGTVIVNGD